jgi:hypothetical protein
MMRDVGDALDEYLRRGRDVLDERDRLLAAGR